MRIDWLDFWKDQIKVKRFTPIKGWEKEPKNFKAGKQGGRQRGAQQRKQNGKVKHRLELPLVRTCIFAIN